MTYTRRGSRESWDGGELHISACSCRVRSPPKVSDVNTVVLPELTLQGFLGTYPLGNSEVAVCLESICILPGCLAPAPE